MASAIVVTVDSNPSKDYSPLVLKLACTAHTDGTFDARQITTAEVGFDYHLKGLYLYEAWAVNPASGHPSAAGAVTIADANSLTIIGSGEFTLSTSASAVVEASLGKTRLINKLLTISIGDIGDAANTVTIYLKFVR